MGGIAVKFPLISCIISQERIGLCLTFPNPSFRARLLPHDLVLNFSLGPTGAGCLWDKLDDISSNLKYLFVFAGPSFILNGCNFDESIKKEKYHEV